MTIGIKRPAVKAYPRLGTLAVCLLASPAREQYQNPPYVPREVW
jgi:hypothetical protein